MSQSHDWKSNALHATHLVTHSEPGHKVLHAAGTGLAAAAPAGLVAATVVAAPVVMVGVCLWGIWSLFNDP